MPDEEALRAHRSRTHRGVDHALRVPGRCRALAAESIRDEPVLSGAVEEAVALFGTSLKLEPGDPRTPLLAATVVLARALDGQGPLPQLARELRMYLTWMSEFREAAIPLDTIRARRAHSRAQSLVDYHLGGAS